MTICGRRVLAPFFLNKNVVIDRLAELRSNEKRLGRGDVVGAVWRFWQCSREVQKRRRKEGRRRAGRRRGDRCAFLCFEEECDINYFCGWLAMSSSGFDPSMHHFRLLDLFEA